MPNRHIYLDNNATTPPTPAVIAAMELAMTSSFGNPSSAHFRGQVAARAVEHSRSAVARLLGVAEESLFFTSGATEANNIAILSCARTPSRTRIVTTTVEHSSILKVCDWLETTGAEIVRVHVDSDGLVDLQELQEALRSPTNLLSVQWVNSETGVIQPIEQIADIAVSHRVPLHIDAAQAFGKLRAHLGDLPVDYASITAHKIHGPQGIGALYARRGRSVHQLMHGGPQEAGRRAGTENVPGIAGFGRAAEIRTQTCEEIDSHVGHLRNTFEEHLLTKLSNIAINGSKAPRLSTSTNFFFSGVDGVALVARLDQEGIYCSQSSACTNHRPEPSYVLRAMGMSEQEAYSCVRFAFSELNTPGETREAATVVVDAVKMLRRFEGAGVFAA